MSYAIHFDFDAEDDPPTVLIWDDDKQADVTEVFEEPICLADEWSSEEDDWDAGPLATRLLDFLNGDDEDEEEEEEEAPEDLADADVPLIGETCKACGWAIVRERTAVQVRRAGFAAFWCCSWACVKTIAMSETGAGDA